MEEYLTATSLGPGLYSSTSRDAIAAQYGTTSNSVNHHNVPPAPAPSPNPIPGVYQIPVPEVAVQPTPSPYKQRSHSHKRDTYRQSSLRERESRERDKELRPSRSRSSMREREHPPKYDDICFDVWLPPWLILAYRISPQGSQTYPTLTNGSKGTKIIYTQISYLDILHIVQTPEIAPI